MEKQDSKNILLVIFAVIITAVIVGGGMYWWQTSDTTDLTVKDDADPVEEVIAELEPTEQTEQVVAINKVVGYNCEQSGGKYSNGTCTCSDGEYEESTGYCITAFGTPGGELHKEAVKLQELVMLKNTIVAYNCEQSGGTFGDSGCLCPKEQGDQFKYDSETGYCMTAFGIPGGELGETEKKLQELQMLKNQ